jgi:hypothetical protein
MFGCDYISYGLILIRFWYSVKQFSSSYETMFEFLRFVVTVNISCTAICFSSKDEGNIEFGQTFHIKNWPVIRRETCRVTHKQIAKASNF